MILLLYMLKLTFNLAQLLILIEKKVELGSIILLFVL